MILNFINKIKKVLTLSEETKKDLMIALYSLPGIIIIYAVGLYFDSIIYTSIAAGGAVTAGYGANKKILKYPLAPMFIAVIGMSICAWIGSLTGHFFPLYILGSMMFASLCALVALIDQNAWWIVIQWAIAFFVAGYYAGDMHAATQRAFFILIGGLFQCLCIIFLLRKLSFHRNIMKPKNILRILKNIHQNIDKKIRFSAAAVYAFLTVFLCFVFIYLFKVEYYYWATMTAVLILKPDFVNTFQRVKNRLIGTFAGIMIATGLVLIDSSKYVMAAEIIISLYLCYAMANQSYAILTTFITISAVLMFAINGTPEKLVAVNRILATAIGGISALLVMTLSLFYMKISGIINKS